MKVADLSAEVIAKIKSLRYDQIINKHEGPESWSWELDFGEFLQINGHQVLLPVDKEQHPNITIIRCIESKDEQTLTLFLKNTTYVEKPEDEFLCAGFIAVCDKFPKQDFYLAILFHEWFMIEKFV